MNTGFVSKTGGLIMGFFSWLTCDTKESVANRYTSKCRTVFLSTPDGVIREDAYGGYGEFGGKDAYALLAIYNGYGEMSDIDDPEKLDELRTIGVQITYGCNRDKDTGKLYSFCGHYPDSIKFEGNYGTPQKEYDGKTPNQLRREGQWELYIPELKWNIKLSFDENCDFDKHNPSEDCPNQGCWS